MTTETTETAATTPTAEGRALVEVQRDNAELARKYEEQKALTASAIGERDTFKAQLDQAAPKARRHDDLLLQVETLTNERREGAILGELQTHLPHLDGLALRGVVTQLHDQKEANRFAEDAKAEAGKFLELIKVKAPSLTRVTTGGGSHNAHASNTTTTNNKAKLKI
jgi:hypothetical protein